MRVLVDYRSALRARTGAGAYVHELVRAYAARHADPITLFSGSWKDRVPPGTADALRVRVVDRRVPVRLLNALWHRAGWPAVEWLAGPADVVHAGHPLLIPTRNAAQVVTVHDLYFLSHPEHTPAEIRRDYPPLAKAHAQRADAVVTSSHHTKMALVRQFDLDASDVHVVRPGAPRWTTLGLGPNVPAEGYVLFVGTLEPRKNLGLLLDAYERLARQGRRAPPLTVAGGPGYGGHDWLQRIGRPPLNGLVTYKGYVPESAREDLYRGARLLALPSWDEGFGLPALEAMAAGIPVLASTQGSLPEVVGAAGTLLSPTDVPGWADALEGLGRDDAAAVSSAEAGLVRAGAFTWEAAADALRSAYMAAVEHRRGRS